MVRLKIVNVGFVRIGGYFEPFEVDKYRFTSVHEKPAGWPDVRVSPEHVNVDSRTVSCTGYVEFSGRQEDSILFRGGIVGSKRRPRRRKLIDDILVLASILTGRNWELYSRREYSGYPVTSGNHLACILPTIGGAHVGEVITEALDCIRGSAWQTQFEQGFHLTMLKNHANVLNTEARFLSLIVIWEWLYAHIKNPTGATAADESRDLKEVLLKVLETFWPGKANQRLLRNENVLHVLRNQLAHSGRLPIDRSYAPAWMKQLHCDFEPFSTQGVVIRDYIRFFERLTQVVVLKTLGIDAEGKLAAWSFEKQLDQFLQTGRLP